MQDSFPKLLSQSFLGDHIYFMVKFFFQEQRQAYQVEQVCFFIKINQNVNIAGFFLLLSHKRAEQTDLSYFESRQQFRL